MLIYKALQIKIICPLDDSDFKGGLPKVVERKNDIRLPIPYQKTGGTFNVLGESCTD